MNLEEATKLALQGKLEEGNIPFTKQKVTLTTINDAIKKITGQDYKLKGIGNYKKCVIVQRYEPNKDVKNVHITSIDNPIEITLNSVKDSENNFKTDQYTGTIRSLESFVNYVISTRTSKSEEELKAFKDLLKKQLEDCKNENYLNFEQSINKIKRKKLTQQDLEGLILKNKYKVKTKFSVNIDIEANIVDNETTDDTGEQLSLF